MLKERFTERIKGIVIGLIIGLLVSGSVVHAVGDTRTLENVLTGVKIVVDGTELIPTDANGSRVEPFIYNGTTYLPVRAISSALGKAVYWDGPNFTVYLGDMDGKLEYPTAMLKDMTNIGGTLYKTTKLTDNYGNRYSSAVTPQSNRSEFEYLLNMKYSRFRATLYVPAGMNEDKSAYLTIKADGRVIYTSPEMAKASSPVQIDLNVTGCNDFVMEWNWSINAIGNWNARLCLADAGFYQ